jgi:hypothetical protein
MEVSLSGNEILVYGATGGAPQLKWLDRTGKVLAALGEPTQAIDMFRLSPDQQHVAVQYHSGGLSDLWLLDTQRVEYQTG